jgi:hypothetical protein
MDTDTQPFVPQGEPFPAQEAALSTGTSEQAEAGPPLWKQLAGAGVGMMIALGLYYGYQSAKRVAAHLMPMPNITQQVEEIRGASSMEQTAVRPQKKIQPLQ